MAGIIGTLVGGGLFNILGKAIDKIFPDPEQKARAQTALMQAEAEGRLEEIKVSLSAILAEAQSPDPWTSRARPTFLYVIYLMMLLAMIGSIIGIWWPHHVATAATNLTNLLSAIPENVWWLFGAGYLGYSASRSFDKWKSGAR
jgi:hypothetical protein